MKAKVSKLLARRRRRKFSGFLVPYAKEIEDFGGRPTRYGARALPGMPAASKRDARRRSAVSTRLRSCPNRRHLGGCCGAAAGGAATGRQIQRSGHPPAIHWKGTKAPLSAIHRRSFPSLKAGYTVDAHIEALVDERDVASSFVPGHCSRRKAPYTAKYISLHLSYRRPGVQPPPVRLSSTLAPAK